MLDRQFLKDQQKELNFINSPDVPTEEMARLGKSWYRLHNNGCIKRFKKSYKYKKCNLQVKCLKIQNIQPN